MTAGLRPIPLASRQAPLPPLAGIRDDYLKAATAERRAALDLGRMLSDPKIIAHDEVKIWTRRRTET